MSSRRPIIGLLLIAFVLLALMPGATGAAPGAARNLSWLSDERSGVSEYTISPDGRYVVYYTLSDAINPSDPRNLRDVYLVATAGGPPRRLTTVQRGVGSFTLGKFSPDSRYLVYALLDWPEEGIGLYSVRVDGGDPVRLNSRPEGAREFEISPDSSTVFSAGVAEPITGGPVSDVARPASSEFTLSHDGRYIVSIPSINGENQLFSAPIAGGPAVRLDKGDGDVERALVASDSRRVFYWTPWGNKLYAVDIDGKRLTFIDVAHELNREAVVGTGKGYRIFYAKERSTSNIDDLMVSDDTGGKKRVLATSDRDRSIFYIKVTPDGRYALFETHSSPDRPRYLYSVATAGGRPVKLPGEGHFFAPPQRNGQSPITPDGSRYVYIANDPATGRGTLYSAQIASGKGVVLASQPLQNSVSDIKYALSPDGSLVAYAVPSGPNGFYEIFIVPVTGGKPTRVAGPFQYVSWDLDLLGFTPDSRSLLYVTGQDRPNILDLYIVPVR